MVKLGETFLGELTILSVSIPLTMVCLPQYMYGNYLMFVFTSMVI